MLMKGSRGLVKLMDFGLAQLAEARNSPVKARP